MNAKKAKLIRAAARYKHAAEYEEPVLHRVLQMQDYEKHTRTVREMGPVSPGAPTNIRVHPAGHETPRAGARAMVTSREVEKIRYLPGRPYHQEPVKALTHYNAETGAFEPVYMLIPAWKPIHLKAGSPKRVYRELKRLEQTVGLDALYQRLESEQFDHLVPA